MGLPVSVDVRRPPRDPEPAVQRAFAWLREVDARLRPFRPDSEVTRVADGELSESEYSEDLIEVLALCVDYERRSGGAFRARVPGRRLDPSGMVKEWAVQQAATLLRGAGLRDFCVNAGGDVISAGEPEPGGRWRIGVRHPDRADRLGAVFGPGDGAVATSACYERGSHILDGRTGRPAAGLLSVTVLAEDLTTADATATAAFALGTEGAAWVAAQPGCLVFAVDADRRVHRSAGLDRVVVQPVA
jgi:thiamine biosynthesis lipoprotein